LTCADVRRAAHAVGKLNLSYGRVRRSGDSRERITALYDVDRPTARRAASDRRGFRFLGFWLGKRSCFLARLRYSKSFYSRNIDNLADSQAIRGETVYFAELRRDKTILLSQRLQGCGALDCNCNPTGTNSTLKTSRGRELPRLCGDLRSG
jgi:hypothetical protein